MRSCLFRVIAVSAAVVGFVVPRPTHADVIQVNVFTEGSVALFQPPDVESNSGYGYSASTSSHSIDVGPGIAGGSGSVVVSGNHIESTRSSYADARSVTLSAQGLGRGVFFFVVDQASTFVLTSSESETFAGDDGSVSQSANTVVTDLSTGVDVSQIYIMNGDGTSSVNGSLVAGDLYEFYRVSSSYNYSAGNAYSQGGGTSTLDVRSSNVPEPTSSFLLGLGGLGLVAARFVRRRGQTF